MNLFRKKNTEQERLSTIFGKGEVEEQLEEGAEKSKGPSEFTKRLEEQIQERGLAGGLSEDLAKADLKWTVAEFWALNVVSVVLFAVAAAFIYGLNPIWMLVGGAIGFFAPKMWLKWRQKSRLGAFNDQLGDAITLMANGLRAGYSMLQSMESVGREMPSPIADEFRRVVQEVSLGVDQERAFNNLLRRVPSGDLDLMVAAINVQSEVGGNLAEILEVIGEVIRERVRIKGQIAVLTSQAQMSGVVITLLPVLLGMLLFAMNEKYMGRLIYGCDEGEDFFTVQCSQPCGWAFMTIAASGIIIGYFVMQKLTQIEV